MSCARATTRDISRWFAFSSVIVLLGCVRVAELPPPDPSNPLPKGVERNEADFLKQIDPYKPTNNPHERQRKAEGCFLGWCPKTVVRIVGLGNTYDINPKSPPTAGRPVAHLANLGKKVEKYYGLLPQGQADYYLWVDAKSSTQAQWTLLQLSHSTHTITAALPTDLNYCHLYKERVTVSEADFAQDRPQGPCNVEFPDPVAKVSQASIIPTALVAVFQNLLAFLAFAPDGGGWIYCSNGCCT
jgi:hypothetical protein